MLTPRQWDRPRIPLDTVELLNTASKSFSVSFCVILNDKHSDRISAYRLLYVCVFLSRILFLPWMEQKLHAVEIAPRNYPNILDDSSLFLFFEYILWRVSFCWSIWLLFLTVLKCMLLAENILQMNSIERCEHILWHRDGYVTDAILSELRSWCHNLMSDRKMQSRDFIRF